MKWIAVSIVAFVVCYTLINFYYRKSGKAFEPHEDLANRATTARLLKAGWNRIPVTTNRPADHIARLKTAPAAISRAQPGLPAELATVLGEPPRLLATIGQVVAPAEISRGTDYAAVFQCRAPDLKAQLGGVSLYRKRGVLILIPSIELMPGKLLGRSQEGTYCLNFPTRSLPPGRYTAHLVALGPAARWEIRVK
ncbi:MAG: hypothetical protein PHQ04_08460 [Opitutaceae bacterium]|nr:hypothetical protein [Opitutaceae bacterium]